MRLRTVITAISATLLIRASAHAQPGPEGPIVLNHFFVVLPKDAYDAIRASEFMTKTFAPFEARTTVRNDQTYTGIYFYGRKTYFEFFEPEAQGPVGASGVALGVDSSGHVSALESAWKKSLGGAQQGPVTRRTETDEAPWFDMVSGAGQGPALRVWFMEYHRAFLARWYPELTSARGVTRAEVLDRYVAKIGRSADREGVLLENVTGLTLALDPHDRNALVAHLRASGWAVADTAHGGADARGPESVRIVVGPKKTVGGIVGVTFALQSSVPKATYSFGSSVTLTVEGARAVLRTDARP